MGRVSIKRRVITSFLVLVIIILIFGSLTFYQSNRVENLNGEAMKFADQISIIKQMENEHLIWADKLNESILLGKKFNEELSADQCDFNIWYLNMINSEDFQKMPEDMKNIALSMEKSHANLHTTAELVEKQKNEGNKEAAINTYQNEFRKSLNELFITTDSFIEQLENRKKAIQQDIDLFESRLELLIIIVSSTAIIATIIFAKIFVSRIVNPIKNTVKMLKDISDGDGDLTQRVKVETNDEIGDLAREFNRFIDNIQNIVKQVNRNSDLVVSSAQDLSFISEETTKLSNEITSSIQEIASGSESQLQGIEEVMKAMEEMTKGIQHTAETTSIVSDESTNTANDSEQGNISIQKAVKQMESINKSVLSSTSIIKALDNRSNEIGEIIEVITGIAEQTNLLSLNAAIEAARAGENGRGFAVVANEVRLLAEQSKKSAEQISLLIKDIQHDTLKSVEAMDLVSNEVNLGIEFVHNAGDTFETILKASRHIAEQIQEVSAVTEEMSASSEEIGASLEEMTRISKMSSINSQNSASSSQEQLYSITEVSASANKLNEMAQVLKQLVAKFRV